MVINLPSSSVDVLEVAVDDSASACCRFELIFPKMKKKNIFLQQCGNCVSKWGCTYHTAGLDTIFIQIYMDALPGDPGVSKNQIFFYK